MHNHSKCEHKLEFCKVCDVVYCNKCKEEWKKNLNWTCTGTTTIGSGTGGLQYYTDSANIVYCSHNML